MPYVWTPLAVPPYLFDRQLVAADPDVVKLVAGEGWWELDLYDRSRAAVEELNRRPRTTWESNPYAGDRAWLRCGLAGRLAEEDACADRDGDLEAEAMVAEHHLSLVPDLLVCRSCPYVQA